LITINETDSDDKPKDGDFYILYQYVIVIFSARKRYQLLRNCWRAIECI